MCRASCSTKCWQSAPEPLDECQHYRIGAWLGMHRDLRSERRILGGGLKSSQTPQFRSLSALWARGFGGRCAPSFEPTATEGGDPSG